jgi:FkbM family methyltransferase
VAELLRRVAYGVRRRMPAAIKNEIARVGRFFDKAPPSGVQTALERLRQRGFAPTHAVDVGAYVGDWARQFRSVFGATQLLLLEAQESKAGDLERACREIGSDAVFEIVLLGADNDRVVRFVEMETGSSVFEEASSYARHYVDKRQVTLDAVLQRHPGFQTAQFLKLDVQGYELQVLQGAKDLLPHVECVLLEASLIPTNRDCPLIDEVMHFMKGKNFRLLDICSQIRRSDGALWQCDLLFLRATSAFLPTAALNASNWI